MPRPPRDTEGNLLTFPLLVRTGPVTLISTRTAETRLPIADPISK